MEKDQDLQMNHSGKLAKPGRSRNWVSLVACLVLPLALGPVLTGCATFHRTPDSEPDLPHTDNPVKQAAFDPAAPNTKGTHASKEAKPDPNSPCWYGNYLGPGNSGYDHPPIDALDAAARVHDLAYDQNGTAGFKGTFTRLAVRKADLKLAGDSFRAIPEVKLKGKLVALATGLSFGSIGLTKVMIAEVVTAVVEIRKLLEGRNGDTKENQEMGRLGPPTPTSQNGEVVAGG